MKTLPNQYGIATPNCQPCNKPRLRLKKTNNIKIFAIRLMKIWRRRDTESQWLGSSRTRPVFLWINRLLLLSASKRLLYSSYQKGVCADQHSSDSVGSEPLRITDRVSCVSSCIPFYVCVSRHLELVFNDIQCSVRHLSPLVCANSPNAMCVPNHTLKIKAQVLVP